MYIFIVYTRAGSIYGPTSQDYVLGQTDAGRRLFVVVTVREELIRVISARDMSRRERKEYENAGKGVEEDTEV